MSITILLIPSILIGIAVIAYLRERFDENKMHELEISRSLKRIPIIMVGATLILFLILLSNGLSPVDHSLLDGVFRLLIVEAILLYSVRLYEKIKYIHYLEVVMIVLEDVISEEDRKIWMQK